MNFQSFRKLGAASLFAAACFLGSSADAQAQGSQGLRVAEGNNLYCAGYVQSSPIDTGTRIVGSWNEQDGNNYAQFEYVYMNVPAGGAKVGDVFAVVRPKGQVKTKWTKKSNLGFLVQEVGTVEVVRVKSDVVVAKIQTSCDGFMLGDLIRPVENRQSPMFQNRPALDLFGDPSGKASGRLFMAQEGRETLSRENIVYVDLGADDNVRVGDYLTVFRPLGMGNPFENDEDYKPNAKSYGYESFEYKGGKFSTMAARKSGDTANGRVVTSEKAKEGRPFIRKVVGELVVLNVKEKTATAVVVRNAQEIHTGDWVEIQ